jgi:hypothetical protein
VTDADVVVDHGAVTDAEVVVDPTASPTSDDASPLLNQPFS